MLHLGSVALFSLPCSCSCLRLSSHAAYLVLFFFFLFKNLFGCTTWHLGSYFPDQESNLRPLHWRCGVLTTGSPGKSPPCPSLAVGKKVDTQKRILLTHPTEMVTEAPFGKWEKIKIAFSQVTSLTFRESLLCLKHHHAASSCVMSCSSTEH